MDEDSARLLGARIALLREKRQAQSLGDLAAASGLAKSYLSKIEKGEVQNPGLATLSSIATALGTTVHNLLPKSANAPGKAASKSASEEVMFERIADTIPEALRQFLDEQRKSGDAVPDDAAQALAVVKLRGKRPQGVEDYRLLYSMIRRLVR